MNAAARALAEGSLVSTASRQFILSRQILGLMFLVIAVLASAVAVVYVKNLDRQLFIEQQTLKQTRDNLGIEYGQLLLEQNTWAAPARVQTIAQRQLSMGIPATKDIAVITLSSQL